MEKALEVLKEIMGNKLLYFQLARQDFSIMRINEAIAELEAMKQRTCDSCKHIRIKQFRNNEVATCTNDKCNEMCDYEVGNDFCCNKFEPKDNA